MTHHIFRISGVLVSACGVDPADDHLDLTKRIDEVTCKECMMYWEDRFHSDVKRNEEPVIHDGPVPN